MNSNLYSQSDDDIFSYDPSTEPVKSQPYNPIPEAKPADNVLLTDLSRDIKDNDDETFDGNTEVRVKLAEAILTAYNHWTSNAGSVGYFSTLNTILDELTAGRFGLMYFYNTLEQKILRRININFLLGDTFTSTDKDVNNTLKRFLAKIGVSLDGPYLPTYVGTLVRMSNHILIRERVMYLHLSEKYKLPVNPIIFQENPNFEEIVLSSRITVSEQHEKVIRNQFISNTDQIFLEKLNDTTSSNINFKIRSI